MSGSSNHLVTLLLQAVHRFQELNPGLVSTVVVSGAGNEVSQMEAAWSQLVKEGYPLVNFIPPSTETSAQICALVVDPEIWNNSSPSVNSIQLGRIVPLAVEGADRITQVVSIDVLIQLQQMLGTFPKVDITLVGRVAALASELGAQAQASESAELAQALIRLEEAVFWLGRHQLIANPTDGGQHNAT